MGINLDEVTYDFTIGDEDGEAYTVAVPFTDFLLPGEVIGEPRSTCFIGVFKNENAYSFDSNNKDQWVIGNQYMKNYYAVFDATPADEKN